MLNYLKKELKYYILKKKFVSFIFIFLLCGWNLICAQIKPLYKNIIHLERVIVSKEGANEIEVDNEGNLFLLNTKKNKIYKYFASVSYDSSYSIGGVSTRDEGFFHPVKISAKNRQTIYLLDDVRRRIILLNTNFKILGQLSFIENKKELTEDIFPLTFDINEWGELFVLNFTNNKIYKYDDKGNFVLSFGGLDYGEGQIINPVNVCINAQNLVFVGDTIHQCINIFDVYGIFQYKIASEKKISYQWSNFTLSGNNLIFFNKENVTFYGLDNDEVISLPLEKDINPLNIIDVTFSNKKLFILNNDVIYVFSI